MRRVDIAKGLEVGCLQEEYEQKDGLTHWDPSKQLVSLENNTP